MQKSHTTIIIGTGFSGICMAIKLKEKGIHDFIILEKSNGVGGTWRENTYPGAECDIPSALYSYSFEQSPNWEYKWSSQSQILEYIEHCVSKYKIKQHIHFSKEFIGAKWNADTNLWAVSCADESSYLAKTFVTAIGQLHHPQFPSIKGIESFEGTTWHSAQWNHDVPLAGKNVAVIGTGASAIQFIPEIAKTVKSLIVFQRTPNWIIPKQDRLYKNWEKKLVAKFPFLLKLYRLKIFIMAGGLFLLLQNRNHLLRKIYEGIGKRYIKKNIKEKELVNQLIPKFPLGAKRLLFSDTFYQALSEPNVQLMTEQIDCIKHNSIQTKTGKEIRVDHIIYATGFKTNPFLLGLAIEGKAGLSIQEYWKKEAKNFKGITVPNFPNMFMMYGPNTNLGHNSIILMSEAQAHYIAKAVELMEEENYKTMEVKESVMQNYFDRIKKQLQHRIWSKIEKSWYKTKDGNIPNNWPGRTSDYKRITKKINKENYTFT